MAIISAAAAIALLGTPVSTAGVDSSCDAVTKATTGPRNVGYRLRCDFSVDSVVIRTSRRLSRVTRLPAIDSDRAEDRLECARNAKRRARCTGDLSVQARIRGGFAVPGDPCEGLVTRFQVRGGACTDDVICFQIAYSASVRVAQPRGC